MPRMHIHIHMQTILYCTIYTLQYVEHILAFQQYLYSDTPQHHNIRDDEDSGGGGGWLASFNKTQFACDIYERRICAVCKLMCACTMAGHRVFVEYRIFVKIGFCGWLAGWLSVGLAGWLADIALDVQKIGVRGAGSDDVCLNVLPARVCLCVLWSCGAWQWLYSIMSSAYHFMSSNEYCRCCRSHSRHGWAWWTQKSDHVDIWNEILFDENVCACVCMYIYVYTIVYFLTCVLRGPCGTSTHDTEISRTHIYALTHLSYAIRLRTALEPSSPSSSVYDFTCAHRRTHTCINAEQVCNFTLAKQILNNMVIGDSPRVRRRNDEHTKSITTNHVHLRHLNNTHARIQHSAYEHVHKRDREKGLRSTQLTARGDFRLPLAALIFDVACHVYNPWIWENKRGCYSVLLRSATAGD